jgi:hypothetical protein
MSAPKSTPVDDAALDLSWGAKNIAVDIFKKSDPKSQRKVEHLARTGRFPGLTRIGRRLCLNRRTAARVGSTSEG